MEDEGIFIFFFWVNVHVEGPWWTVIISIIEKKGKKKIDQTLAKKSSEMIQD